MKVTVVLLTYNHEKFIVQALESILSQVTNFSYNITIVEDFSSDKTREIVTDYQVKYPDKINLVLSEYNRNDNLDCVKAIQSAQGEYIALIDGDDYWSSNQKLQKQADFLDAHLTCSMCFHKVRDFYEDGSEEDFFKALPQNKQFFTSLDLYDRNFIDTCSIMLRRLSLAKIPEWFRTIYCADWVIQFLCAESGTIGYIDEVMGAWRIHKGGAWNGSSLIQQRKNMIKDFKLIRKQLRNISNRKVSNNISKWYFEWALEANNIDNRKEAKKAIVKSFIESFNNSYISNEVRIKLLLKIYFPGYFNY
ncbi:MAG: glycosyltransferase [Saprospiraceae bacterium]